MPTLEAEQKMIAFYHAKDIDMLKLGCTLPNLANICLHKSTDAKFYPFTEGDKYLLGKIREDVVGGLSIVLHVKQLLMKHFFENQQTYANLLLGLTLANYTPTRCVNPCRSVFIRVGISTQKQEGSLLDKTKPTALIIWSCLISNEQDQNVKLKTSLQQAERKKIDCFSVDGFCSLCNIVFEVMGCFYHFCPCQELRPSLTGEDIQRGSKKRELDALRGHYMQEKGFKVVEMWECEWWRLYKTSKTVKQHIREHFPYRRSLAIEQLLEEIKEGKFFG